MFTEARCIVRGKVQGVRYRDYVQQAAGELALVGYVRNCADGTVEVRAHGTPDALKDFVEYLHEGSILSKVESVEVEWHTPRTTFDDFSVLQ